MVFDTFEDHETELLCGDTVENKDELLLGCNEIERLFFMNLLTLPGYDAMFNGAFCFRIDTEKISGLGVELCAQCQYPGPHKYRTDFSLLVYSDYPPNGISVDIEIDGHDFHEKTKEQAAKDKKRERWLVSQNVHLLRFTGSEVFKNPGRCWSEVFNICSSLLMLQNKVNK